MKNSFKIDENTLMEVDDIICEIEATKAQLDDCINTLNSGIELDITQKGFLNSLGII